MHQKTHRWRHQSHGDPNLEIWFEKLGCISSSQDYSSQPGWCFGPLKAFSLSQTTSLPHPVTAWIDQPGICTRLGRQAALAVLIQASLLGLLAKIKM